MGWSLIIRKRKGPSGDRVVDWKSLLPPSCQPMTPEKCRHSRIFKGKCVDCAESVVVESHHVALNYIVEGLKVGVGDVARLKNIHSRKLLSRKMLHLVLDLDHTLLHAKDLKRLTSKEERLMSRAVSVQDLASNSDGDLFKSETGFLVKLRPFVRKFLREASSMFEIYVCTKGSRTYAHEMVKILDPDNSFLSNTRVITLEDLDLNGGTKSLNLVMARESNTIIVDDKKDVWDDDNLMNLIEVGKYVYFKGHKLGRKNSYFRKNGDENESNGTLSNVLRVLKKVHTLFFDEKVVIRDVRGLMRKVRGEILMGCHLYFREDDDVGYSNHVDDDDDDAELKSRLAWSMAEDMGCKCTTVLDPSVTHVVTWKTGSESCLWAVEEKKFAVHPKWVFAAYYLWCKQPEDLYLPP